MKVRVRSTILLLLFILSIRVVDATNSQANAIVRDSSGNLLVAGLANNSTNGTTDMALARYLPDGSLDTTFNPNGLVPGLLQLDDQQLGLLNPADVARTGLSSIQFGRLNPTDDGLAGIALDQSGKIVGVGFVAVGLISSLAVIRLNTDGTLDQTFNANGLHGNVPGVALIKIGSLGDLGTSVAIDSQGRIVVVGSTDNGLSLNLVALRLTSDGELDPTFNAAGALPGILTIDLNKNDSKTTDTVASSVALNSDDTILIGGTSTISFQTDFLVIKLTTDGVIDTTFGLPSLTPGIIQQNIQGFEDQAFALKIDSLGRIVIGGFSTDGAGQQSFALARYTKDGELDTTFNPSGVGTGVPGTVLTGSPQDNLNFIRSTDVIRGMAITDDDKIVVSGFTNNGVDTSFITARYTTQGSLDSTFNPVGVRPGIVIQTIKFNSNTVDNGGRSSDNEAHAVVLGPDGQIFIAGFEFDGLQNNVTVISYLADGQLDTTFNSDGLLSFQPGIVITRFGESLTSLGNGVPDPLTEDVSGVSPDILKSLEYPPQPVLPHILTDISSIVGSERKKIQGVASPTSLVSLYIDENLLTVTIADNVGRWSAIFPPLTLGKHHVQVVSLDLLSGAKLSSPDIPFSVEAERMIPPVIESPKRNERISSTSLEMRGYAHPGVTVTIFIDGKEQDPVEAGRDGRWHLTTKSLAEGPHVVRVVAKDAQGAQSLSSPLISFNVESIPELTPRISTPKSGLVTTATLINLTGEASPNSSLQIMVDGSVAKTITVPTDGKWKYDLTKTPGTYDIVAVAQKNKSSSERIRVTIEPSSARASKEAPKQALQGLIRGTALPGSRISLLIDKKLIGSTSANEDGQWSFTPQTDTPLRGTLPVTIQEVDDKGAIRLIERLITF